MRIKTFWNFTIPLIYPTLNSAAGHSFETKQVFIYSNLTIEALEQDVKYV